MLGDWVRGGICYCSCELVGHSSFTPLFHSATTRWLQIRSLLLYWPMLVLRELMQRSEGLATVQDLVWQPGPVLVSQ